MTNDDDTDISVFARGIAFHFWKVVADGCQAWDDKNGISVVKQRKTWCFRRKRHRYISTCCPGDLWPPEVVD